jgi:hypothetical protein
MKFVIRAACAILVAAGASNCLGAAGIPAVAPARVLGPNPYEGIVSTITPALVTIKYTMKIATQGGERERPREVSGVMIQADGLVLASNIVLNPYSTGGGGQDVTATPSDFKVLVGEDTEGVTARLIATDKELDLAWIKIDQPASGGYKALDLSATSAPALGDTIVCVDRMGKLVDRAPKITVGRAAGTASKPRKLYMADALDAYPGTPAFTLDGKLVGLVSFQLPDGEPDESVMNDLRRLGPVVLPAENVSSATKRVLEQEADRAKSGGDAAKTPAPAAEKKPEGDKK